MYEFCAANKQTNKQCLTTISRGKNLYENYSKLYTNNGISVLVRTCFLLSSSPPSSSLFIRIVPTYSDIRAHTRIRFQLFVISIANTVYRRRTNIVFIYYLLCIWLFFHSLVETQSESFEASDRRSVVADTVGIALRTHTPAERECEKQNSARSTKIQQTKQNFVCKHKTKYTQCTLRIYASIK